MTMSTHDDFRGKSANGLDGKDCILIKIRSLAADLKFQRTGLGLTCCSYGEEFSFDRTPLSLCEGQNKQTWGDQKIP